MSPCQHRGLVSAVAALTSLCTVATAHADKATARQASGNSAAAVAYDTLSASSDQPTSLTEVVVTAERRKERIQDVPIDVVVNDAAQLRASGVTNIRDLELVTPGLRQNSSQQEVEAIRGVMTQQSDPGNDPILLSIWTESTNRTTSSTTKTCPAWKACRCSRGHRAPSSAGTPRAAQSYSIETADAMCSRRTRWSVPA